MTHLVCTYGWPGPYIYAVYRMFDEIPEKIYRTHTGIYGSDQLYVYMYT